MSVDLEALKRWQCDCCCVETELEDVVTALERISELERTRDGWEEIALEAQEEARSHRHHVEGLWKCGNGHILEIEAGTPPYDMGLCPICAALERAERVEAAARFLVFEAGSESEQAVAQMALIEVLSAGPALAAAPEGGVDRERKSEGVHRIAVERERQMAVEGWTPEHDDEHTAGEMALAAAAYALPGWKRLTNPWPWGWDSWKPTPTDRVRELVKAGALIAAEIDRLQRLAPASGEEGQG